AERGRPGSARGGAGRAAGRLVKRQVHPAEHRRRPRPPDLGHARVPRRGPHRRGRCAPHPVSPRSRRVRLPALQPHPQPHRARERHARERDLGAPHAGRGGARARRARRPPRSLPGAALGRRAAAGGHRARRGQEARAPAVRRADRRPRRRDGPPRPAGARAGGPRDGHHDRAHHAQRRDRRTRRPGPAHEQRPHRRGRGERGARRRGGDPLVRWPRLRTLDRKMLRELWRLRSQLLSIGAVVATAVVTLVALRGTHRALAEARDAYYRDYRLADVWAPVERAPETLREEILAVPGVAAVATRVTTLATLDLPWLDAPGLGLFVSIPDRGAAPLGALHLVRGRRPAPANADEVLASEAFAR